MNGGGPVDAEPELRPTVLMEVKAVLPVEDVGRGHDRPAVAYQKADLDRDLRIAGRNEADGCVRVLLVMRQIGTFVRAAP